MEFMDYRQWDALTEEKQKDLIKKEIEKTKEEQKKASERAPDWESD
jgi:hypothetical protein